MGPRALRRVFNLWPPFLFAGIHVVAIGQDWRSAEVELRMRPWNRNVVGTHFGGSLFAMTDPFWMILVMRALGPGYTVWDRAGEIAFLKPGRGTVRARFQLDEDALRELRDAADTPAADRAPDPVAASDTITVTLSGAVLRWFQTDVLDAEGATVARVRKQIYVRRRAPVVVPDRVGVSDSPARDAGAGTVHASPRSS